MEGDKGEGGIVCLIFSKSLGPLTQEVEYLPFKQRVVGSSPARPTNISEEFGVRTAEWCSTRSLQAMV